MKSTNKLLLFTAAIAVLFSACEKEDQFDGPALDNLFGDFMVNTALTVIDDSVDFAAGEKGLFDASFSIQVAWKLEIIGQNSGAVKELTGFSQSLSVPAAEWNGSTTHFPVFSEEPCDVRLTFDNHPDTMTANITVASMKTNQGLLVSDFENGFNTGWNQFVQSGANMNFMIDDAAIIPQGENYFAMAGEVNWDYLIGLIEFRASAQNFTTYPVTNVANDLFVNVMLYGEPGVSNGFVLLRFPEDENGDGLFDEATEDTREYRIDINFEGWKLFSVRYSDIVASVTTVLNGNNAADSDKIHSVDVLMLADPATGYTQAHMDYLFLSEGAPVEP